MLFWTSPWLLGGLALAGLPLLAHLLHRHARQRVIFPTTRFLRNASAQRTSWIKLRRLALLALRLLAVLLIVLAFMRPIWQSAQVQAGGELDATALVIVFDTSASMQQLVEGVPLQRALAGEVERYIDGLRPGVDSCNLIVAGARPSPLYPQLTQNLPAVRAALARVEVADVRADLAGAIAMAEQLVADYRGRRQLLVVTDRQASNWQAIVGGTNSDADDAIQPSPPRGSGNGWPAGPGEEDRETDVEPGPADGARPAGQAGSGARTRSQGGLSSRLFSPRAWQEVTLIPLTSEPPANAAIVDPHPSPAGVVVGQPTALVARVRNLSREVREVRVELRIEGTPVGSQIVRLAAGDAREVAFPQVFEDRRPQRIEFVIPADGLEVDNHARLVVYPRARLPILLVGDDPPEVADSAAFYLQRALAPYGQARDRYEVTYRPPAELSPTTLAGHQVVFLAGTRSLPPPAIAALWSYVERGGSVIALAGPTAAPALWQALDQFAVAGEPSSARLPWLPGLLVTSNQDRGPSFIASGRWRSKLLADFDEQNQSAFQKIPFTQWWSSLAIRPSADVLLSFDDDLPALAAISSGAGQFFLVNMSPEAAHGAYGKQGAFVALMNALAREAAGAPPAERPLNAGPTMAGALDVAEVSLTAPVTMQIPAGVAEGIARAVNERQLYFELDQVARTGFVSIDQAGRMLTALAINAPVEESDLARLDANVIRQTLLGQQAADGDDPSGVSAASAGRLGSLGRTAGGTPLWGACLLAGLACVAVELVLLARWKG